MEDALHKIINIRRIEGFSFVGLGVTQFTGRQALGCVLHRPTSCLKSGMNGVQYLI